MSAPMTRRQFIQAGGALAALSLLGSCTRHFPGLGQAPAARDAAVPQLLLDALQSDDLVIQADAARLLGDLGSPKALGPLIRYVTEDRRYAKTAGIDALARIGDTSACRPLRRVMAEPNVNDDAWWYGRYSVQVAAALALLALGDDSGADYLINDTEDHKQWALSTWFAPTALRLPDKPEAARRLKAQFTVEFLLPEGKSDPGQLVIICDALSLVGTDEACEALASLLDHLSRYVRGRAALGLMAASARGGRVLHLQRYSRRVERVATRDAALFARIKAAEALVTFGCPGYAGPIAEAITAAHDPFDRAAALDSLGAVGGEDHVPLVIEQLESDDAYVRLCAAEALDRIGAEQGITAVAQCRSDPDMRVRLQVAKCLAARGQGDSDER